jgi:uncharacterized protein (TIGR02453 family)
MAAVPRFTGFAPAALRLLASLERHNDRTWFASRKERFEAELLEPMRALVLDASEALAAAKVPIGGDARRSVFRIYRDVRFTPDKRPYKTHLAAYLSRDGGRRTPGGCYVHVAPRDPFLAVAFYQIEAPLLQRWRQEMVARPRLFAGVVRALERRALVISPPEQWDDALVRMPRDFKAMEASDVAPFFRLRSFVVRRPLEADDLASPALVHRIVEMARDARPLLNYGWRLIDGPL